MSAHQALDEQLFDRIRTHVAKVRCLSVEEVSLDSRLGDDLGMDGDDAVEFFQHYAREFHVDLAGMRWKRHFGPEAGWTPLALFWPPWWRPLLPVTVAQLVESARAGHWVYDYPDAPSRTNA